MTPEELFWTRVDRSAGSDAAMNRGGIARPWSPQEEWNRDAQAACGASGMTNTPERSPGGETHTEGFLHDDSCPVCRLHRQVVDAVKYSMMEELQAAMKRAGVARPWSPQEEWSRMLKQVADSP